MHNSDENDMEACSRAPVPVPAPRRRSSETAQLPVSATATTTSASPSNSCARLPVTSNMSTSDRVQLLRATSETERQPAAHKSQRRNTCPEGSDFHRITQAFRDACIEIAEEAKSDQNLLEEFISKTRSQNMTDTERVVEPPRPTLLSLANKLADEEQDPTSPALSGGDLQDYIRVNMERQRRASSTGIPQHHRPTASSARQHRNMSVALVTHEECDSGDESASKIQAR